MNNKELDLQFGEQAKKTKGETPRPQPGGGGDAFKLSPQGIPEGVPKGGSLRRFAKERRMPISLLPDVRDFRVKVSKMDWLFELFGIAKREAPAISYEVYKNREMNRFLLNQMLRLERCRRKPTLYWVIAKQLMRSTAFTVSSIQHVIPG